STSTFPYSLDGAARQELAPGDWRQVSTGLMLVLIGDMILLTGALMGLAIFWLALTGGPFHRGEIVKEEQDATLLVSAITAGLGALLGYGLILPGQWRCQSQLPAAQKGRGLITSCLGCVGLALFLLILAGLGDYGRNYRVFGRGPEAFDHLV